MARRRRPNRLAAHISPPHLFLTGIVVITAFLFQQNLVVRAIEVALFAALAELAGKRIRWGYFSIMVITITIFNLLAPVGEVLVRMGPVAITRGALIGGLMKGLAIPGLVFISLFAVNSALRLPGRFGGLIVRLFFYFERLLDGKSRIRLRGFIASIDEVLMELLNQPVTDDASASGGPAGAAVRPSTVGTTRRGYTTIAFLVGGTVAAAVVPIVL